MDESKKHMLALIAIVLLSIVFRFYKLGTVPVWDFDEGYNMRYAYDLLQGQILWFAIKYTFIPHPPLFFMAYAPIIHYFGAGVYNLRALTAFYGVLTTIVIYITGRRMFNPPIGLIGAFIYAATPEVVFWNRIGFANNQFILLSALSLYFIHTYSKTGKEIHLIAGSLSIGLSVITEYTGLFNLAAAAVYLHRYHPGKAARMAAVSLLPTAILFAFMLCHSPGYFLFDAAYQLHRFFSPLKITAGLIALIAAYKLKDIANSFYSPIARSINEDIMIFVVVISLTSFYATEDAFWHATTFLFTMSFFGLCVRPLFLMDEGRERALLMLFLAGSVLSMLALDRADHMTMVIYPHASIALASLLYSTYGKTKTEGSFIIRKLKLKPSNNALLAACFYPLAVSACLTTYLFIIGGIPGQQVEQVRQITDYINGQTNDGDLVLTYSWMFPLITNARVGLITQSIAYDGIPIAYYSGDFPKDRFSFNTSYARAKFIVGANGTSEWITNQTGERRIADYIEGYNKTYVAGFLVYRNTAYNSQN
ncbi:MAG: glycosyltransferase family 39 protein [Candidatus Altiarchaeota archaeon]|nr:glycosyltransferase family 39 protein [Candidatus Altiarchaeota archaeon]